MSTNYTGNPTATQAPGPTPAPGNYPIVVIPVDGDALNSASIAQALKENADFIAYLQQNMSAFTASRTRWLGSADAVLPTANWAVGAATGATGYYNYVCNTVGAKLTFDIPLAYSSISYEKLTSVGVKMYKQDTNPAVATVSSLTGISGTNVIGRSTIATGTNAANNECVVTVGSLTASASSNNAVIVSIVAAAAGDLVYGITYTTTETLL